MSKWEPLWFVRPSKWRQPLTWDRVCDCASHVGALVICPAIVYLVVTSSLPIVWQVMLAFYPALMAWAGWVVFLMDDFFPNTLGRLEDYDRRRMEKKQREFFARCGPPKPPLLG